MTRPELIKERSQVIKNLLSATPNIPHLTGAKLLCNDHPDLFDSVEAARSALRLRTGNTGKVLRDQNRNSYGSQYRAPFTASREKVHASAHDLERSRNQTAKAEEEAAALRKTIDQFSAQRRSYTLDPHSVGNTLRFAVISDTHFGSLYERLDALTEFLRMCEREGIKDVYHTGDLLDGHGIYKGQVFEQYAVGFKNQLKVFVDKVPDFNGLNFYFITGNHDSSFSKLVGMEVGKYLETQKKNWHFVGADSALLNLRTKSGRTFKLSLVHPGGGTGYALSYHPQKHVESLPGGQKPDAVFMGHYHKTVWMPMYRNVDSFCSGCLQSQTPFMASRNLAAMVGGWTVEATVTPRACLTRSIRAEFHSFFEPDNK